MEGVWADSLNQETRAFFVLLQAGLWDKEPETSSLFPLSRLQWEAIYRLAQQQTVLGWVYQGICALPDEWMPQEDLLMRWVVAVDEIEKNSRRMNRVLVNLNQWFLQQHLHPVVLKGQGAASFYSQPLWRECGDIDLYFPDSAEEERALNALKEAGIKLEKQADGSTSYQWKGVEVEHHPFLVDLMTPALQPLLEDLLQKEDFMEVSIFNQPLDECKIRVPSPTLNALLLNAHILKHTLGWGVGLRQICDLARFYALFHPILEVDMLKRAFNLSGIENWVKLLHAFMVKCLHLPQDAIPFSVPMISVDDLLKQVLTGGNFGQYREGRKHENIWKRKWHTAASFLQNVKFACRYAPKEAMYMFTQLVKGQTLR